MANDKSFKIKNGLSVGTRYESKAGADGAGADGPSTAFNITALDSVSFGDTITTGIDLSTDGGLIWLKKRDDTYNWHLVDTVRGAGKYISSNSTAAQATDNDRIKAFNTDGFLLGSDVQSANGSMVYFSFKETADFFDVLTYTGTGVARTVSHNLGSVPGMIIVKRTDSAASWNVYHRGLNGGTNPHQYGINLNTTGAEFASSGYWNDTAPTSTEFTVGTSNNANASGGSYVAYLFAHDTASDGLIQCGSYTGGASSVSINLGWEPQWILIKRSDNIEDWSIVDNVRGMGTDVSTSGLKALTPNTNSVEETPSYSPIVPSSTGFTAYTGYDARYASNGGEYIYVAIRSVAYNYDLDLSTGTYFSMTPSGDTTITISNPPASGKAIGFALEVNGDGSTLTWPSSVKWHEGTTPTATATKELYTFITTDGGTTYYGKKAGENLA